MVKLIATRRGRELNEALLSPGELKQVKRARSMTPQEFAASEEEDFVFLASGRESGGRAEARVKKVNDLGAFQGLYKTADDRLITVRSKTVEDGRGGSPERRLNVHLAEIFGGRVVESPPRLADFRLFLNPAADSAELFHREVRAKARNFGIGSELVDKIEKSAAANGARRLIVNAVCAAGDRQDGVIRLLEKRGYSLRGDEDAADMVRILPSSDKEHDFTRFHTFVRNPSGRRKYYFEPIKTD